MPTDRSTLDMLFTGDGEAFNVGHHKSKNDRVPAHVVHRSDSSSKASRHMPGRISESVCV